MRDYFIEQLGNIATIAVNEAGIPPLDLMDAIATGKYSQQFAVRSPEFFLSQSSREIVNLLIRERKSTSAHSFEPGEKNKTSWCWYVIGTLNVKYHIPFEEILHIIPYQELLGLYHLMQNESIQYVCDFILGSKYHD